MPAIILPLLKEEAIPQATIVERSTREDNEVMSCSDHHERE